MGKGGGPQNSTTQTSNIPEYAKPYVMNMLGATQNQLFNTTPGTDGQPGQITGFKPYQAYSNDPTQYFAGPSNLQQSTYNEATGMQTPGGYGAAQGLTGLAAMGQMGAGRQFQQQATNPYAVQAYMSPYMQNVVDTQKTGALRDFQVGQTARQGQQTRQGAFGGSRSAIENAEAQRNLMSQLQGIQATGTQQAFQNAQAQQQFGANLGLQGLQGAASSAGQLGQLAGAQQQSDLARMQFQNQLGGQQQQYQQGIINQAIQDYATAQQYPYMQLGMMSNMLRGLPMQQMTTQSYQAQPNLGSQVAGLGATALGAYGAAGGFRAAEGGEVKSYAVGGLTSSGVANSIENQLYQKEVPELIQIAKTNPSEQIRKEAARIAAEKQAAAQTQQSMGLESAPAGNLDDIGMAGGGIVAFADTGVVGPSKVKDEWEALKDYDPGSTTKGEGWGSDISNFLSRTFDSDRKIDPETGKPISFSEFLNRSQASAPATSVTEAPATSTASPNAPAAPIAKLNAPAAPAAPATTKSGLEATLADYNKFRESVYGKEDPEAIKKAGLAQIEQQRADLKEQKNEDFWRAIMMGGLGAAGGKSQNFIANIAEGAQKGLGDYATSMKAQREDKKLLLQQQVELEKAEEARKAGRLKDLMAHADRLEQIKERRSIIAAQNTSRIDIQNERLVTQMKKDVFSQVLAEKKIDPMNLQENPALMAGVEAEVNRRLSNDELYMKKMQQLMGGDYRVSTPAAAVPSNVTVKKIG